MPICAGGETFVQLRYDLSAESECYDYTPLEMIQKFDSALERSHFVRLWEIEGCLSSEQLQLLHTHEDWLRREGPVHAPANAQVRRFTQVRRVPGLFCRPRCFSQANTPYTALSHRHMATS